MTEPKTKEEFNYSANNQLIAEFMGYVKVRVGYFDDLDPVDGETEWQRNNDEWMDKVGMDEVGDYFVNVEKDLWFKCEDANYHAGWNKLMEVWEYARKRVWDMGMGYPREYFMLQEKYANKCIYPDIKGAYEILIEAINWYNTTKQ